MKTTDELRAELDAITPEIERLADLETITPEEDAKLGELLDARDEVKTSLVDAEAREARIAEVRADRAAAKPSFTAPTVIRKEDAFDLDQRLPVTQAEARDRGLAAIEASGNTLEPRHQEAAERLLRRSETPSGAIGRHIVATGSPLYRSAFHKLTSGQEYMITPDEQRAIELVRAASLTDNAGGYAIPFTLDTTIIDTGTGSVNPFRQISRVEQIVTDTWNGVSSAGVTAAFAAEAAEAGDNAPTLAQPSITTRKAHAFVPFSVEIGGDWASIDSDVRSMFMTAKDDLEATVFATGAAGSNQPIGIVTALDGGSSEVAPAVAETFAAADVYALEEALPAKYRTRASWVANKAIYNDIRQFDTGGGAQMWERIGAGQPAELLGYRAYEASAMDSGFNAAATADNFILLLGDFSNYVIVDRIGMSVELVPHLFATGNNRPSGQRGFYCWWRVGADSVNDGAFRLLNVATTA